MARKGPHSDSGRARSTGSECDRFHDPMCRRAGSVCRELPDSAPTDTRGGCAQANYDPPSGRGRSKWSSWWTRTHVRIWVRQFRRRDMPGLFDTRRRSARGIRADSVFRQRHTAAGGRVFTSIAAPDHAAEDAEQPARESFWQTTSHRTRAAGTGGLSAVPATSSSGGRPTRKNLEKWQAPRTRKCRSSSSIIHVGPSPPGRPYAGLG